MVQMYVVRACSTDFDEQGRIKGTLDIPLSDMGRDQVGRLVGDLHEQRFQAMYASPCRSAQQTAAALATDHQLKVKILDELQNLDHGLWHGKLVDEVRVGQPKVFRQLQEHPETVCPPQGEPVGAAVERVRALVSRLARKHKSGAIAIVAPEPIASFVRAALAREELGDLWKVECECGGWQAFDVAADKLALAS